LFLPDCSLSALSASPAVVRNCPKVPWQGRGLSTHSPTYTTIITYMLGSESTNTYNAHGIGPRNHRRKVDE